MKLLFCKKCSDLFKLDTETRECKCGKTKGRYKDNIYAIYSGRFAKPMGLNNIDLYNYIWHKKGKYIECWFITKDDCCDTFQKLSVKEYKLKE